MLKPSYKTENKPKFEPLPEDTYQVVVEDITEKEQKMFNNPQENEIVLNFQFLILDEGEFKGRKIWHSVRPIVWSGGTSGKPSWLFRIWKAAMQEEPASDFLTGDEINSLIGKQLRLNVTQTPPKRDGNIYNKVDGVMMIKQKLTEPKLATSKPKVAMSKSVSEVSDEDIPVFNNDEEETEIDLKDVPF